MSVTSFFLKNIIDGIHCIIDRIAADRDGGRRDDNLKISGESLEHKKYAANLSTSSLNTWYVIPLSEPLVNCHGSNEPTFSKRQFQPKSSLKLQTMCIVSAFI